MGTRVGMEPKIPKRGKLFIGLPGTLLLNLLAEKAWSNIQGNDAEHKFYFVDKIEKIFFEIVFHF